MTVIGPRGGVVRDIRLARASGIQPQVEAQRLIVAGLARAIVQISSLVAAMTHAPVPRPSRLALSWFGIVRHVPVSEKIEYRGRP